MNKTLAAVLKFIFFILIVSVLAYVGVLLVTTAYEFGYRVFTESAVAAGPGEDVLVQIKEGMSDLELGRELEEKGLVRDGNLFVMQLKLSAYDGKLEPGVYTLNTSMTAKEMIVAIVEEAEALREAATEVNEDSREGEASPEDEAAPFSESPAEDEGTAPVEDEE